MLIDTRRRALGLIIATAAAFSLPKLPRAMAATATQKKKDCFESKAFGPWKAQATDVLAGARINEVGVGEVCPLRVEIQVAASFEGKLVVYGDPDDAPLPRNVLVKPENRLIVRDGDGKERVNEPLCGNCTDIFDDKVSIVLPLACAPLFRDDKSVEMTIKLDGKDECRFKLDCESLRAGLKWASERKMALAALASEDKCTPREGCFITSACCEALGLAGDCFELRTLRRYRDEVLALRPDGHRDIAAYYDLAPLILARMPEHTRKHRLCRVYARYILPASLAAWLKCNTLAYRLYTSMMQELVAQYAPEYALPN
ncbi:MAG TPA: CFI-box-CTERM domain-containing protein [Methyloceanibacter sp.]|nr:CFI-box-CTERM domain-containing protein [Methyloceanibacter sp.]